MVEVPADGFFNTFFELQRWLPSEFVFQLGGVDGITQVVAGTVGNIGDQFFGFAFSAPQ
ncbi:hypothetical protein SDC9_152954 [bioreactor metagenome]|uniref:Uncharacterized protein n=1 Tax=bioreactor metagenome TaxID=1076179 RepID=A0A645EUJ9_9ZZZZ